MSRILLVEDDPDLRFLLSHVLYDGGYEIDPAESFVAAKRRLGSKRYDLVLADAILADGSGLTIADLAAEQGIPALILTGYAARLAPDLGRYDYMLKPVPPGELLEAIGARLKSAAATDPA